MVPLPRFTTVKGIAVGDLVDKKRLDALIERARNGGAEIVGLLKTGSAYYAPAAAAFEMVKSILLDEKRLTLRDIGERVGERVWPLPLYEEYLSYLKSDWADLKNTGSRWGGPVTAGTFLKQFVPDKVAWAHLDIAGVAYAEKEHNGHPKGASGFGVVLTVSYLQQLLK